MLEAWQNNLPYNEKITSLLPSSLGRFYMGINWQWNVFGSPKICVKHIFVGYFLANSNLLGQYG